MGVRHRATVGLALIAAVVAACSSGGGDHKAGPAPRRAAIGTEHLGRQRGHVVTATGQVLTPAGTQVEFSGRAVGVAVRPDGRTAALLAGTALQSGVYPLVTVVDLDRGMVVQQFLPATDASYAGITYSSDGSHLFASARSGVVDATVAADGTLTESRRLLQGEYPTGLALTDDGKILCVGLSTKNALALVDVATGNTLAEVAVGNVPHAVVVARGKAYVSNQGGRPARAGDFTNNSAGTPIVADRDRGAASTGTVSVVDLTTRSVVKTIDVELQPTALATRDDYVFVANTNSDSVSVVDSRRDDRVATFAVAPNPQLGTGSAPNGLAVLPDGRLLVTLGRDNALAVYRWRSPDEPAQLDGLLPTGWYPADVAVPAGGRSIVVANALGVGTLGPPDMALDNLVEGRFYPGAKASHTVRAWVSSASIIVTPSKRDLDRGAATVAHDNGWDVVDRARPRRQVTPVAVPEHIGEPSKITKVVYVIKENRTYDQVLGDDPRGNGDPSLVQFGRDITPNQHAIARRWVLLDNFYSAGAVSADGHQWVTQADDSDYVEKMFNSFPGGRSYPSGGGDALAYLPSGFLWENAQRRHKSVRVYGEYAEERKRPTTSDVPSLDRVLDREYPPFDQTIPDQDKAKLFLDDLHEWERSGDMPDLVMMLLPNDHTMGTAPGYPTPQSQVADNDAGLGDILVGLSHSRFWDRMAVFVVEDDAQGAVDHVDGHRTTAYVASPYAARGKVDHTFYTQVNMVRTIEQILGLPPMNRMDVAAVPMRTAFTEEADTRPFDAVERAIVPARNPAPEQLSGNARAWALASARMDFSVPDVEENRPLLNRALWYASMGYDVPYPGDGRVLLPDEVVVARPRDGA